MTIESPMRFPLMHVVPEWIDYNGHMNVAFYVLAFDKAVDELLNRLGVGVEYVKKENASFFTLQIDVKYLREVVLNDPLRIEGRILDFDEKRVHYCLEMYHDTENFLAAATEQVGIHVSLSVRRSAPFPDSTIQTMTALRDAHATLSKSEHIGKTVGITRKS